MVNISKLRGDHGEALVRWLNGPGYTSRLGLHIYVFVRVASSEGARKVGRRITVQETFEDWVRRVNEVLSAKGGRLISSEFPVRASDLGLDYEIVFSVENGKVDLDLVPVNEDSKALFLFKTLTELGGASRVRFCENCERFFYARRADRQTCSSACKVALWQKTPAGRVKKAEYMRKYRANPIVQRRAQGYAPKGWRRNRGRKVHLDLKKGE